MAQAVLSPNAAAQSAPSQNKTLVCPACGRPHTPADIICGNCGTVFIAIGKTRLLKNANLPVTQRLSTGDAHIGEHKNVSLVIGEQSLSVTVSDALVLGRDTGIDGAPTPDVDLTRFGGEEKGVSRRHVRMECQHDQLYVIDLGSSNGTRLNGRLLVTNSRYLLRNGDELRLGLLKIHIRF